MRQGLFNNLNAFFAQNRTASDHANNTFQDWLIATLITSLSQSEREQRMRDWEQAPSARCWHPREEHLLPLHVCLCMADAPAKVTFDDFIAGVRALAFLWQADT